LIDKAIEIANTSCEIVNRPIPANRQMKDIADIVQKYLLMSY
jgi:hypothetical protein